MNQLRKFYPRHSAGKCRSDPEYKASLVPYILRCIIHASLVSIGLIVTWKWDMPMKNFTCSKNFNMVIPLLKLQHETLTGTVKHTGINEGQRISLKENCSKYFNLGHRCWRQHRHQGYQIRSPQLRWGELKMNDNKQTEYQENLLKNTYYQCTLFYIRD